MGGGGVLRELTKVGEGILQLINKLNQLGVHGFVVSQVLVSIDVLRVRLRDKGVDEWVIVVVDFDAVRAAYGTFSLLARQHRRAPR